MNSKALYLVGALGLVTLAACGTQPRPATTQAARSALDVQLLNAPAVAFDSARAATTVVFKFVARQPDGTPMGPHDVDIELLLEDRPLDSEAILQEASEARAVDVVYSLVLDATYSMLLHNPPAFEPMKQAAQRSVQTGLQLWRERPGSFTWALNWFDDYVYRPDDTWPDGGIMSIPTPAQGLFTRLYSAIDFAIDDMARLRAQVPPSAGRSGRPSAPHQVLVVFSDGQDNHSWQPGDATDVRVDRLGGLAYRKLGWRSVSLTELLTKIGSRTDLTVHTIGMGDAVNDQELRDIAQAGRGIYVNNPASDHIDDLFARVTREFTTLQTAGATIPNPPGDYVFTLRVRARDGAAVGQVQTRLHAGDTAARVL